MNLASLQLRPYEVPFKEPYVTASVRHETRRGTLITVRDETGTTGLGEAAPLGPRTEDQAACRDALEATVEHLADATVDPRDPAGVLDDAPVDLAARPAARFGLTLALCDLAARRAGQPLATWLSETHGTGHPPTSPVPVNATIPAYDQHATLAAAQEAVAQGFSTLKLKVGRDKAEDEARIRAVRETVGETVALRLDANQAWTPMEAIERLADLTEVGLEYVEQPTPGDDLKGLALVREGSPVPVAADEPIRSLAAARALIELDAADVLILKPMVLGGLDVTLDVAALAQAHDVQVVVTSTIDGAIARAGALHVAAALDSRPLACGLATGHLLAEDVVDHEERIEEGAMHLAPGTGHGIDPPPGGLKP